MSKEHAQTPPDGLECLVTMEDITAEDGNYVEYQTYPSMLWHPALMERSVVLQLQETQFDNFITRVKTTDCQAELRRLLEKGPPVWVSDPNGMPLPDNGDTHICKLWFHNEPTEEKSAKLKNAVEGVERQKLWDELKEFIITDGKDSDSDVEDNK